MTPGLTHRQRPRRLGDVWPRLSEKLQKLGAIQTGGADDLVERALGQVAAVHWDDDPVGVIGVTEDGWLPLTRSSFQPQRSRARIAWRGVTAGSRGVTPRR